MSVRRNLLLAAGVIFLLIGMVAVFAAIQGHVIRTHRQEFLRRQELERRQLQEKE